MNTICGKSLHGFQRLPLASLWTLECPKGASWAWAAKWGCVNWGHLLTLIYQVSLEMLRKVIKCWVPLDTMKTQGPGCVSFFSVMYLAVFFVGSPNFRIPNVTFITRPKFPNPQCFIFHLLSLDLPDSHYRLSKFNVHAGEYPLRRLQQMVQKYHATPPSDTEHPLHFSLS